MTDFIVRVFTDPDVAPVAWLVVFGVSLELGLLWQHYRKERVRAERRQRFLRRLAELDGPVCGSPVDGHVEADARDRHPVADGSLAGSFGRGDDRPQSRGALRQPASL